MSGSFYGSSYDRYVQRTDDSKSHKLKSAYWTTKQAMLKKFGKKEDQNIVASDADLDAKLELLKSVQTTCRDLSIWLVRYQETICYLSQAENEMGRFLKQHSLEDKTQAGKIMSAVGKALSHSAQQRLLLRAPLDRLQQEVKTFRQRAIADTVSTLKRMETSRTEYRGALLWMKNVSEELDPDTYKQLEKFRCVQSQVRKNKAIFDRLKIDSMQKIDLLSASRCNMLSHVLAAYQNSLLNFLERTSRTMVAVAERFKGYQYYEFSVLKHLRPDSRKLAGRGEESGAEDSESSSDDTALGCGAEEEDTDGVGCAHTPPDPSGDHARDGYSPLRTGDDSQPRRRAVAKPEVRSKEPNETDSKEGDDKGTESAPTEEELDRRLDEIFRADDTDELNRDEFAEFQSCPTALSTASSSSHHPSNLLAGEDGGVPAEHRDFLTDLFAPDESSHTADNADATWLGSVLHSARDTGQTGTSFTSEWNSVFALDDKAFSTHTSQTHEPATSDLPASQSTTESERDPWAEFERSGSSVLPSQLLDQRQQQQQPLGGFPFSADPPMTTSSGPFASGCQQQLPAAAGHAMPSASSSKVSAPNTNRNQTSTSMDAWMSLFSDLGPLGNPDAISKKDGQISDA